jgi:hypothetical protein
MSVPVWRYWNDQTHDHLYCDNAGEIGTTIVGVKGNHGYTCEGEAFHVYKHAHAGLVPIYRYWQPATHDHLYTQGHHEIGASNPGQTGNHGYTCEGIIGYVSPTPVPGGVAIYRYWQPHTHDHLYTTNAGEIGTTNQGQTGNHGYASEGILGYSLPHVVPIHRYWQPSTHDHLYCNTADEIGTTTHGVTGKHGYASEGVSFHLSPHALPGLVPVYRYWQAQTHDHLYTQGHHEINASNPGQTGNHGYTCEGILGYISPTPAAGLVPVYRYWQPSTHDHLYTANAGEIGTTTQGQTGNHGYASEGVLGYAFP